MASQLYQNACSRDRVPVVQDVVTALEQGNAKELTLSHRKQPLTDVDACCIAEALTMHHTIRVLDLEENKIGAQGLQALLDAFNVNPGFIRELRLGKNALRDPPVVALGNALSVEGAGLKVVDLSQNSISKLGAQALSHALSSRSCDLVEVSFHCNDLDGDAGLYLAQGVRASTRLKHLHLGYNSLRCGGTTHLARCLPIARSLLTLDLTANRIGTQGGADLVKALLTDSTNLQRLNLRHNNLDDDTISLFAQVLERNSSLQQLFLGYMNPSFETAELLLSTLAHKNKTLVCFDCYGWKLQHHAGPVPAVDDVMRNNQVLRALVTDHDFGPMEEEGNQFRSACGWHELYLGGDDRLAAQASVRHQQHPNMARREQSQSRSLPQQQQPSHHADPEPEPVHNTTLPSDNHRGEDSSVSPPRPAPMPTAATSAPQQQPHRSASSSSHNRQLRAISNQGADEDLDQLVSELDTIPCDPDLRNHLALIIAQLQLKMEVQRSHHQQQITLLEERLRGLERSREDDKEDCSRRCAGLVAQQLKKDKDAAQRQQLKSGHSAPTTTNHAHPVLTEASRVSPVKSASPQRQQPTTAQHGAQPTAGAGAPSKVNTKNGNRQSEPAQRPPSPPAKSQASQPRSIQGAAPQPRSQAPQATGTGSGGAPPTSAMGGVGSRNQKKADADAPVRVGAPGTVKERGDSTLPKSEMSPARSAQSPSKAGSIASPDPRQGTAPATAGENRASSPPVRPTGAGANSDKNNGSSDNRENSHGPGEGAVLSVPEHPKADTKVEHSPAPFHEDRSGTPDLQTSHHGQGQAPMAPQPQRSSAPSRPRGTKMVDANVAPPAAFGSSGPAK